MKRSIVTTLLIFVSLALFGQCIYTVGGSAGRSKNAYTQYETTGNPRLDNLFEKQIRLCLIVYSLNAVDFYFHDDRGNHNAVAFPVSSGVDIVSFGMGLIRSKRAEFSQRPDQACAAIVAHEMAHIKQFERGGLSGLALFQRELHADFLAGYFMGYKWRIELATEAEAETFFDFFFTIGDNSFESPNHHGTSAQRKQAAMRGWRFGQLLRPINYTYDEGVRIVSQFQLRNKK